MASDIGFFHPDLDESMGHESIVHLGKDTFFRDVYLFLDRAKDLTATKGERTIRENL